MRGLLRDEGVTMLHFSNAEGKEWMVPEKGIRTGLLLYQPSGWRGQWLKRMLPGMAWWRTGRKLMHVKRTQAGVNEEIRAVIEEAFGVKDFEYAIFLGTPCADQKATIQVYKGQRVMGYCKVADKEQVGEKFQREMSLLDELNKKGMNGIPKGLACGQTNGGLYYFAQSTTKTLHSTYPHHWGRKQDMFLNQLYEQTRVTLAYEDTDFCECIDLLKSRIGWLKKEQQATVEQAIHKIEQHFRGKPKEWSVYHGDFTPWNTFVTDGRLFVFDWAYTLRNCPPRMDRYHWLTQVAFFEKHLSADELFKEYKKKFGNSNNFSYLCYLIATIALYVGRERNALDVKNIGQTDYWTKLIKLATQS